MVPPWLVTFIQPSAVFSSDHFTSPEPSSSNSPADTGWEGALPASLAAGGAELSAGAEPSALPLLQPASRDSSMAAASVRPHAFFNCIFIVKPNLLVY